MLRFIKKFFIILLIFIILVLGISFFVRIDTVDVVKKDEAYENYIESKIFEHKLDRISLLFFIKTNFFDFNYDIPHVKKVKAKFVSPTHIIIELVEKNLIGYVKNISGYYYFDEDLYISEMSDNIYNNTIEVTGLNTNNLMTGTYLPESAYKLNLPYVIKAVTYILINKNLYIDSIIISNQEDISLVKGKIDVKLGNDKYIEEKLNLFYSMYYDIKDLSGTLDLSTVNTKDDKGEYIFKKR